MATYGQWFTNAQKDEVRRVTWVCGDQRVLVEEVVDTIRGLLTVSAVDSVSILGGSLPDSDVWAATAQYPMQPGANRLVLVRDAERIKNWSPLGDWLGGSRRLPTVYLVFVSGQSDFPYQTGENGKRGSLQVHAELFKKRGHLVRCSYPPEEVLLAWVQRRSPLDVSGAVYLLGRAGGDLSLISNVCKKLSLFSQSPGTGVIDQLCREVPSRSFVDSLVSGRRGEAMASVQALPLSDYRSVIGLLDYLLDVLGTLQGGIRAGKSMRELVSLPGVPAGFARQLADVARDYPPAVVAHRRRLLGVVDDSIRSGAKIGVLESLVALW